MKRWRVLVAGLVVMVGIFATISIVQINATGLGETERGGQHEGTIMRPDKETLRKWIEAYYSAPQTYIVPEIRQWIEQHPRISFALLDHLEYDPAERNQGYCGNCWVWAGTGILGIALDVQGGGKDRLSTQYLTSCWWACCGGNLDEFAGWYQAEGFAIPWSNANAHWQDGAQSCGDSTTVPCGTISTSPNYPITNCVDTAIGTHGLTQQQAIANIKNVLHQNKAEWFSFYLPNDSDWDNFRDFWSNQPETAIWNPDFSSGHTWVDGQGGGHAVLCVGYDDTDPNNSYWTILNSWGTTSGRPNGLFRLDMNMDYDNYFVMDGLYYSLYFETLDVTFTTVSPVLEVDPSSLDFGEMGTSSSRIMTFRAYNSGGGTLSGTISDNRDWIAVSLTSFEGNDNTISVTVDTNGLTESLTPYTGTVTVTSNGGTKTVEVSVTVIPTGAVPFPNPVSLSDSILTFWGTSIPYAEIRIYGLAGELVKTLDEIYGASKVSWDGRNEQGNRVARGVYFYTAKDFKGKFVVK